MPIILRERELARLEVCAARRERCVVAPPTVACGSYGRTSAGYIYPTVAATGDFASTLGSLPWRARPAPYSFVFEMAELPPFPSGECFRLPRALLSRE